MFDNYNNKLASVAELLRKTVTTSTVCIYFVLLGACLKVDAKCETHNFVGGSCIIKIAG